LRFLFVTPMPPDNRAASAIPPLLHAQLDGLKQRHGVTIVTVAGPDPEELEAVEVLRDQGVEVHAVLRRLTRGTLGWRRRTRIAGSWVRGRVPLRTAWFAEPAIQDIIDSLTAERDFDAVLVEDNAMASYRFPSSLPAILTEYEVRRPRRIQPPPRSVRTWPGWAFNEADWRRWPLYERAVWRRFDVLQVFTQRDALAVAEVAPDLAGRVRVNPFAIKLPTVAEVDTEPDTLVFAGNFTHPPNVDAALWLGKEILPRLARIHPGVRVAIAGPSAPPEVLALQGPRLRCLGRVADLDAVLRRAAVVIAPLRIGGGMRMKVLHAMALAKPVVTTARGAAGFDADPAGPPLVLGDDAGALAEAAAFLLRHPQARHELGARARAYVEKNHSPAAYVSRLEAVLAGPATNGTRPMRLSPTPVAPLSEP
jgi:glycosyltransferase involved in cell wall biosynthesis